MVTISGLFIYPIKSMGGISLTQVGLCKTGFEMDRRWMLIDDQNRFVSQREFHLLALFKPIVSDDQLSISWLGDDSTNFSFNFRAASSDELQVSIWEDECMALAVSKDADDWFSARLDRPVRLVYMPDHSNRWVDPSYAVEIDDMTSFSDGYPVLMISEESLTHLNSKLDVAVGSERFRPNLLIKGVSPHEEDNMAQFTINDQVFHGVKPCARCLMTSIDQETAAMGNEPLKTLAAYRKAGQKIYFGQNVIAPRAGYLRLGNELVVKSRIMPDLP